jgi:hypothetical protein
MVGLIRAFANDPTVILLAVLLSLDFVLGVTESIVNNHFRLAFLSDYMRNDVLGKLIPYYAIWAALHVAGDFTIAGFEVIEETLGSTIALAFTASIFNSLAKLKLRDAQDVDIAADPIVGDERPPAP